MFVTPELISKQSKLKMISHNWPINVFIFAFPFMEGKEGSKDRGTGAGQVAPALSEPQGPLPSLTHLGAHTPISDRKGALEPVSPQLPSRGRMSPDPTHFPSVMPQAPLGAVSPEQRGLGAQAEEPPCEPRPARPSSSQGPLLHAGFFFFFNVGGELGAVERTRILHSLRGAENPPPWLQRAAHPGPEEAGTGRKFENVLVTRLPIHRTRQDQPRGGAA